MSDHEVALMQQLHDEHAAALWHHCLRLTGWDRPRAEDLVQDTLLRAWRHRAVLDNPPTAVRAWLFTVARNIVIDEWRSRGPAASSPVAEVPEARDPDDRTDQLLQSWVVAEALTQLSAEHRAVLLECYYRGPLGRRGGPAARRPGGHREVAHALRAARAAAGAGGDGGGRMTLSSSPTATAPTCSVRCRPAERLDFEQHLRRLRGVRARGARARRPAGTAGPRGARRCSSDAPRGRPGPGLAAALAARRGTSSPSSPRAGRRRPRGGDADGLVAVPAGREHAARRRRRPRLQTSVGPHDDPVGAAPVRARLAVERVAWGTRLDLDLHLRPRRALPAADERHLRAGRRDPAGAHGAGRHLAGARRAGRCR